MGFTAVFSECSDSKLSPACPPDFQPPRMALLIPTAMYCAFCAMFITQEEDKRIVSTGSLGAPKDPAQGGDHWKKVGSQGSASCSVQPKKLIAQRSFLRMNPQGHLGGSLSFGVGSFPDA